MAARHLVRRRPRNLTTYRFYKELTGHQSDMMFMVPEEGLNKMPYGRILRALHILEAALQRNEVPRVTIMAHLKVLMDQLHVGQDPLGETSDTSEVTTIIQKHGGVQTLLSLLMVKDLGGRCCFLETCQHDLNVGSLHAVTLDILRKLTLELHSGARLSESDEVLQILFSLMLDKETYTKAIALVEHLLIFRKSTLQLNTIPSLDRLIAKLDGQYLANFCSILAVTISDLDVYENKTLLYEQSKLRSNIKSLSPLRDINQEFILRIPHFLSRLVDFATKLPYLMNRIQPQTIANQIDSLTGPMLQRVESVYVLGLLLLGKQRKEVQVQLARLRLIPRLSSLFDLFIWKCETYQERIRVPGHLSSCECSPEVALKIQFLRLVHSFCDQSDYRYLMLTPKEFTEVRKIHIHYGREDNFSLHPGPSPSQSPTTTPPESSNGNEPAKPNLPCNDNSQPERTEEWAATNMASQARPLVEYPAEQMCSGSKGLLLKIVEALKKETTGSTFR
ncbi:Short transient receptor potential channel 4-associated protein [Portunus trituberculatus]|uniref:Short transient receptor potential channel 4-associated protein n=1 Tax=Portunus trituberculatus TaxID=210409 RepID=A0A5B7DYK2_PORTR|nr:Short transient receptor potential channel 4-associated protein [Portunus trituberculatus]